MQAVGKGSCGRYCTLSDLKELSTDNFWTWDKIDGVGYDGDAYLGLDKCVNFEKEIWFDLGKAMRRKHRSVFQNHLKYISNGIVKPFYVKIIHYSERVVDMHDLAKQLPTPLMKGDGYEDNNWKSRDK